jgi:hypothetical protein
VGVDREGAGGAWGRGVAGGVSEVEMFQKGGLSNGSV